VFVPPEVFPENVVGFVAGILDFLTLHAVFKVLLKFGGVLAVATLVPFAVEYQFQLPAALVAELEFLKVISVLFSAESDECTHVFFVICSVQYYSATVFRIYFHKLFLFCIGEGFVQQIHIEVYRVANAFPFVFNSFQIVFGPLLFEFQRLFGNCIGVLVTLVLTLGEIDFSHLIGFVVVERRVVVLENGVGPLFK